MKLHNKFQYKGHKCGFNVEKGYAYIFVDGSVLFRVVYPNSYPLEQYIKDTVDRLYRTDDSKAAAQ
jgi:hypothetical protein